MTIGERLRTLRESEYSGRLPFCKEFDIPKQTLYYIETNKSKKWDVTIIEKVGTKHPNWIEFLVTGNVNKEIEKRLANSKDYRKLESENPVKEIPVILKASGRVLDWLRSYPFFSMTKQASVCL